MTIQKLALNLKVDIRLRIYENVCIWKSLAQMTKKEENFALSNSLKGNTEKLPKKMHVFIVCNYKQS